MENLQEMIYSTSDLHPGSQRAFSIDNDMDYQNDIDPDNDIIVNNNMPLKPQIVHDPFNSKENKPTQLNQIEIDELQEQLEDYKHTVFSLDHTLKMYEKDKTQLMNQKIIYESESLKLKLENEQNKRLIEKQQDDMKDLREQVRNLKNQMEEMKISTMHYSSNSLSMKRKKPAAPPRKRTNSNYSQSSDVLPESPPIPTRSSRIRSPASMNEVRRRTRNVYDDHKNDDDGAFGFGLDLDNDAIDTRPRVLSAQSSMSHDKGLFCCDFFCVKF